LELVCNQNYVGRGVLRSEPLGIARCAQRVRFTDVVIDRRVYFFRDVDLVMAKM
jgi:hypothetical protein